MQFSATFVALASTFLVAHSAPIPSWTGQSNVHHWGSGNGNSWQSDNNNNNQGSWGQPQQDSNSGSWNANQNNNNNWQPSNNKNSWNTNQNNNYNNNNNNNQNSWNQNNQQQPPNNMNQPAPSVGNEVQTVRLQLQLDAGETTFVQETINLHQVTPSRQETVFEVDLVRAPEGTYCQILDSTGTVAGFSAGSPAQLPQGVRNPSFLCAAPQA